MIGQYSDIDQEINVVSDWYEAKRHELYVFLEKYKLERKLTVWM